MRDPFARSSMSRFGRVILDILALDREAPFTEEQAYEAILRHTSARFEGYKRNDCDLDLEPEERDRMELMLWFREKPLDLARVERILSNEEALNDYLTWMHSVIAFRLMELDPETRELEEGAVEWPFSIDEDEDEEDDWAEWEEDWEDEA